MTTWINAAKEGKTFGSLTVENDVDISFSSAIATKRDDNTVVIYAHVTGCEYRAMDKNYEFKPGPFAITIYLNDHTDSYGKERKSLAAHKFINEAINKVDGFNTYFSGILSAASDRQWKSYESKTDTKGKPLPEEALITLLAASADLEAIEGKGDLEGVEIPKAFGGFGKKSFNAAEGLNQKLDWIEAQVKEGSKFRTVAESLGVNPTEQNTIIECWLSNLIG